MSVQTTDVLLLILLLQLKHVIADFFLQNSYMIENRRYYGHPGGLLHVAIHLVGSLIALLIMGTAALTILAMLAVEGVFHYHLDWSKDNFVASRQLTPRDAMYWYATGVDQALHQFTYLGMAVWWVLA
ncbi:MAG: DUF3307 domain-containing protein [Cereibacter sphaeroides]|uniref:DUF3307 domain-containing protein n=1 Tax=Cereibacter sphaeroides TaxID=1063 RepID=A0A2W5SED0_CERSP|nr:MAG: DUF3307 domain-containing protein [Cereibacter sphaeroides]